MSKVEDQQRPTEKPGSPIIFYLFIGVLVISLVILFFYGVSGK